MIKKFKIIKYLAILALSLQFNCTLDNPIPVPNTSTQTPKGTFYKGSYMAYVTHQETFGNVIFKENGVPKDAFQSLADHGANIVRLRIDNPPYSSSYTAGYADVDFGSPEKVKIEMQRAKNAGLKTLLTFGYQSMALEDNQKLNDYVAPLQWQSIANDVDKLSEAIYNHTLTILEDYINSDLIPEIVSIGNETNQRFLEPNLEESNLPPYSVVRTVKLLNAGNKAVRDLNIKYNLDIKIACHIFSAASLPSWMKTHVRNGLDFDIMAISHYHAWHSMGNFTSWTDVVSWVKNTYDKDFLIMETAQLFRTGGNDAHVDILGIDNIPAGYDNPPTTNTQKEYLKDFAQELYDAGGLGLIYWGGEWVGSNTLIFPDQYGAGSSWENKAFWDFNYNLHDGVNWMNEIVEQ
ncbi:glycosyl hydrolase 53 family protein [Litoribaculum gwangyangense]|uniref:Arabinogalactan endo-beta-1,4-galactanase n=1 Tax=Litoribaculum gwangyangense TaxID=1130722 RepID=A0ABP9CLD0_9FLAO